jgi:hypothetical protein
MATPLDRKDYPDPAAALTDALRVLQGLEDLGVGRTVVVVDEYAFLARRARRLVQACLRAEMEHGA